MGYLARPQLLAELLIQVQMNKRFLQLCQVLLLKVV
jgi:hypothetical protein